MTTHEMPACLAGLLAAMVVSGCGGRPDGPPRAVAKGTVTLDGVPLPEGVIRFVPTGETKGPKASAAIEQGTFEFPARYGPVPGQHRIEIDAVDSSVPAPDDDAAVQAYLAVQKQNKHPVRIPPVYNRQSQLQEVVQMDGPNEFHFDLVSRR